MGTQLKLLVAALSTVHVARAFVNVNVPMSFRRRSAALSDVQFFHFTKSGTFASFNFGLADFLTIAES